MGKAEGNGGGAASPGNQPPHRRKAKTAGIKTNLAEPISNSKQIL
jgi:hypothetical protein